MGVILKVRRELAEGVLAYSKDAHPREVILLLKGSRNKDIIVEEVIIPPFAVHGKGFSQFNPSMIPFDLSMLGVVHSHPSGVLEPSVYDINHFYGSIMMITAYPYLSERDIAIFDRKGQEIPFRVV